MGRRRSRSNRAGALANDELGREAFGIDWLVLEKFAEHVHGRDAKAKFGLADRGQRHGEVFTEKDIAESDDGDLFGNFDALLEKKGCGAKKRIFMSLSKAGGVSLSP